MFKNCSQFLVLVVLLAVAPLSVAQTMFEAGEFKPYEEIAVSSDALSSSVKNRVLYFAHFTCPFCRNAHEYMHDWGDQLPPPYRLELFRAIEVVSPT